jgi:hypothetical protein
VDYLEKALRVALLAALLRLLVAPFLGHLWDIKTMQETVYYTLKGENVYTLVYTLSRRVSESTGQPLFYEGYAYLPHLALILTPFYIVYIALGGDPQPIRASGVIVTGLVYEPQLYMSKDVFLFMTLIKMPMIVADSLIVYILGKRDLRVAVVYALSPYAILITGAWGMFESLIALSLLLSMMLIERGRYVLSGIAYGFSLIKLYPILALPVFILNLRGKGFRALASFTIGLIISQIPTLLFLLLDPQSFVNTVLLFHILRQPSGLTPLRMLNLAENLTLTSIVSLLHTAISIATYTAIIVYVFKGGVSLVRGVTLAILYFLAFSKVVHEQYYLSVYPLLLQLRMREARLIETLFLAYTLINVGLFLTSPTLLFLIDYRLLQIHTSIVYGDLGYISINVVEPLVTSLISIITFLVIVKTMLNIAATAQQR